MRAGMWVAAWLVAVLAVPVAVGQVEELGEEGGQREEGAGREGKTSLSYLDGLVLGVVEGITEYLPVSSTGHLILANRILGLDVDEPLIGEDGEMIMVGEGDAAVPFTMKQAADGYTIIIQGGAILAVALLYTRRLWTAFVGGIGLVVRFGGLVVPPLRGYGGRFSESGMRLARNLLLAFLPAVVLGLLLDEQIERYLFGPWPVVVALFLGGLLIFWVEAWRKARLGRLGDEGEVEAGGAGGLDLPDLSVRQSLTVGLLQCVAMWPGTSRSMMTIIGGYLVGLSPVRAAEFSFLLGFITLTAASGYRTMQMGGVLFEALDAGPLLFGILVATVSAALAVKWLVGYLARHGLGIFGWYRIAVALLMAALLLWVW
jgi:undecaprenyl-diphosphatase